MNVTVHVPDDRLQLAPIVPAAVLDETKLTVPVGVFVDVVVSATVTVHVEVPVGTIVAGAQDTVVEVLSLLVVVTVIVAEALVLELWVVSPPYAATIDPEPAVVPVKVTEQLPETRAHVVALSEPPVVPAVSVNVTVPVGVLEEVVESITVAVTEAVQLEPPSAIVQLTFGTDVDVESGPVLVTVTAAAVLGLVL